MQIYWTTLVDVIDEATDTKTFYLDLPEGFTWEEGAHTHLALEGFNSGEKPDKGLVRHMSIATLPEENTIGITTRLRAERSRYKTHLAELKSGSSVALFKTHTNIPLKREDRPIYLLSCGVGIASFRPLILQYLNDSNEIDSLHSLNVDSSGEHLFSGLFEQESDPSLTAQYVTDRPAYYQEVNKLAEDTHALFYIVGSDDFLRETIATLRERGISDEQITIDKYERFRSDFLG